MRLELLNNAATCGIVTFPRLGTRHNSYRTEDKMTGCRLLVANTHLFTTLSRRHTFDSCKCTRLVMTGGRELTVVNAAVTKVTVTTITTRTIAWS
jgi:hypothetical protein